MKNLLTKQENRRFAFIRLLSDAEDWVVLPDLAETLDCSSRVLKDDIRYLNEHFDDFTLQTSTRGVRLNYHTNRGFKTFCQRQLEMSPAYKVLETIFLHPHLTVQELAEQLFISPSTLYRLISEINSQTKDFYDFHIDTNPCRIVGDEKKIRYFFYVYIFERYPHFHSSYIGIEEEAIHGFLKALLSDSPLVIDFSFYNVTRVVMIVNLIRYRNQEYIEIDQEQLTAPRRASSFDDYSELFKPFEGKLGLTINRKFITQIFTPYIQKGMSFTYEEFIEKTEHHPNFYEQVSFLRHLLDDISTKNELSLKNKEALVFGMFNTLHLEYQDPQSDFILYNRNQRFAEDMAGEFPRFYHDLYEGMKAFRKKLKRPLTEEGIAFFIYNIFATWKNLVPQLRRKIKKIRTLVISDRHKAHAEMIKDFIAYEFSEQVTVDFYAKIDLNPRVLEELDYDLIVTTFPIDALKNKRNVYLPNVPKYKDYQNIQKQIDAIVQERINP